MQSTTFGTLPTGIIARPRQAAYAVIRDADRIAAVRGMAGVFLPGGGVESGESVEETVTRELREELGRVVRLMGIIGEAVQHFYASTDGCWYTMVAVFFRAEFVGESLGSAEHEIHWLELSECQLSFHHPCHAWAVKLCVESEG